MLSSQVHGLYLLFKILLMYLEIQQTIANYHPLLKSDRYTLDNFTNLHKQNFLNENDLKFIRSAGLVSRRKRKKNVLLEGEIIRSSIKRLLVISEFQKHINKLPNEIVINRPPSKKVYRGLFMNTFGIVNRFQIGLNFEINYNLSNLSWSEINLNNLVLGLLGLKVKIKDLAIDVDLSSGLNYIKKAFIYATVQKPKKNFNRVDSSLINTCKPVIVIEANYDELINISDYSDYEKVIDFDDSYVTLFHIDVFQGSKYICPLYIIENTNHHSNIYFSRLLRIFLLRIHGEKEVLMHYLLNQNKYDFDERKTITYSHKAKDFFVSNKLDKTGLIDSLLKKNSIFDEDEKALIINSLVDIKEPIIKKNFMSIFD